MLTQIHSESYTHPAACSVATAFLAAVSALGLASHVLPGFDSRWLPPAWYFWWKTAYLGGERAAASSIFFSNSLVVKERELTLHSHLSLERLFTLIIYFNPTPFIVWIQCVHMETYTHHFLASSNCWEFSFYFKTQKPRAYYLAKNQHYLTYDSSSLCPHNNLFRQDIVC